MADNCVQHDHSNCGALPECEHCGSNPKNKAAEPEMKLPENHIKQVIGVVSGKGGVGKSMTTAMLAVEYARRGYKVGILDADITGPSIPRMFGIQGRAMGTEEGIVPRETETGIKIMSVNLLLDSEDTPVIWRGPILSGVITQFWENVIWGDLDVLFVDCPPGTGDVPLTVFQSLPLTGIVIVTSPQELVGMIVRKAYNMAAQMGVKVLGIVENMSYVKCPDCGKEIYLFGHGETAENAEEMGVPFLGRVPINPLAAQLADHGCVESVEEPAYTDVANAVIG